ncbi:3-dehydroquinate synthase [Paracnuella aquatica]|uniref:3-dehydroquinate synthase n=1 Tax=Paracnuella aquatica TaxID=2268757 RepID=UPI000DEEE33C|nr:3-dehydroquinate synthase [Paracnuella aquatica]RPD47426.1 3-dehydroquinate synthase [Paracnuella aquatica]
MDYLQQSFAVRFEYKVYFTEHLFSAENVAFRDFLNAQKGNTARKLLFVIDKGVVETHPDLQGQIRTYLEALEGYVLVPEMLVLEGGEGAKNNPQLFDQLVEAVNAYGIDRHSYLVAIGGGSILDLAGYAAAVSHRGIRHIRIPTTVLSQNDSGVGVKNGVNWFGKKNFLGTFAPPAAVFNDYHFLTTLSDDDWRSGMSEAIKVALIKDAPFFNWLEANATMLARRDMPAMQYLVERCAELHLQHIAGGDPFEMGSSRPLDFGHWSAHKLEQLTGFAVRHGDAVGMGIALDSAYSAVSGMLDEAAYKRIIDVLQVLGFAITHPLMEISSEQSAVIRGLNEFREHLGGQLTIMLLRGIGVGEEVHHLDTALLIKASELLQHHDAVA